MNRLKDLREDKDLFQKDISSLLNVDRSTYSDYETEIVDISTKSLCILADFYNVSVDYLLCNTDEREAHKLTDRLEKNRLREIRREKGLRQVDVAKYLNMSQNGLSQYETSTNDIPTSILIKLSEFYDTSIDYILCKTFIKKPYKKSLLMTKEKKYI